MSVKKFSWRAFISISLFFSFFIIFITGIILYLAPAGRVAHWVNWKLLGLSKENWQALHTIFSYLFAILSIFHLFSINWKAFWSYIKTRVSKGINKKRELFISFSVSLLIFIGTVLNVPPLSYVMNFGDYLTESWEKKEDEAPLPHAERFTIPQLVEQLDDFTTDQALNRLKNNKISVDSISLTIREIGERNNISPNEIYRIIIYKPANDMAGTGVGRKTLQELANKSNVDVEEYIRILEANGIKTSKEQTLKDIATANNMAAKDIYDMLFSE